MSEWIKTSEQMPRSGQTVLAFFVYPYHNTRRIIRAEWVKAFDLVADDAWEECDYSEEDDEFYCPEGWYEMNEFEDVHWRVTENITHWMPLPDPPEEP